MAAYATPAELNDYLSVDASPSDVERLLDRASDLLDDTVRRPYQIDPGTQLPTDPALAAALRQACCAQVEFWLEVGEEHDVEGLHNRQVQVGHLNLSALPPEVAPRTARVLRTAGLLSIGAPDASLTEVP